jgi:outer membrane lipoprotein-sorting protein
MGSEFSNADIAVPNLDDYTYTLLGSEILEDTECWKIEARPKNADIADADGYSKKIVFIGEKDFVARRVLYYDFEGVAWKELSARNIQLLDEKSQKYQALEITMINKLNGRTSIMKYDKIHFNPEIKDDCFTIRYLEKAG